MDKINKVIAEIIDSYLNKNIIEVYNAYDKNLKKTLSSNEYYDKESFLSYSRKKRKEKGKIDPSTEFQFIRYVDNEWCVHFTSKESVLNIANNGFKYGTPEVSKIPYGWGNKSKKNGYNYAFLASDVCSNEDDTDFTKFWGFNCVIFRCSGVLGFHRGDKNRQVVFWGEAAHNIIPIVEGVDSTGAHICQIIGKNNNVIYKFDLLDFPRMVEWLENNEVQYRKQLYR